MHLTRRQFLKIAAATGVVIGAPSAIEASYVTGIIPRRVVMEDRPIRLPGLPSAFDGFRISLFSDLHLYPFTPIEVIQEAVALANSFHPDLVILAGDFVWREVDAAFDLVPVLSRLSSEIGTFAVLGNHDYRKGAHIVARALKQAGVRLLINEGLSFQRGSDSIHLAGIDSASAGRPLPAQAFANRREGMTSLVVVHEPDYIIVLAPDYLFDLQLSGHSHGGQVRVPVLGPLILPPMGEIYNMGLYEVGNSQLYTTRGVGTIHLNLRLNCPPEVAAITLHA
jgi:predicted MPP superfamily phosphohydrolase